MLILSNILVFVLLHACRAKAGSLLTLFNSLITLTVSVFCVSRVLKKYFQDYKQAVPLHFAKSVYPIFFRIHFPRLLNRKSFLLPKLKIRNFKSRKKPKKRRKGWHKWNQLMIRRRKINGRVFLSSQTVLPCQRKCLQIS